MALRSMRVVAIAVTAFVATAAVADDLGNASGQSAAPAAKPQPGMKKPKNSALDAAHVGLDQIQFSQPNASPLAPTKNIKAAPLPRPGAAPSEPRGGVSLDFKWRASNDKVDPFDAVRHSSGPNSPGDAVQGGVKIGF
jgi:hypothetical protein